jgi:hypothetical protein
MSNTNENRKDTCPGASGFDAFSAGAYIAVAAERAGAVCLNSIPGFLSEAPALGFAAAGSCGWANQA